MSLYNYVNFIVACDNKGGIGKNNKLPWHISEDLKYFKKLTNKNTVIMGSKTYFSIPKNHRPLSNRLNLVLTNNKDLLKNNHNDSNLKFFNFNNNYNIYDIENYDQIYKLNKISLLVRNTKEFMNSQIFIIGGEQIYNIFFNLLKNDFHKELQFNNIYLTYIEKNYNCDTFFPKLIQNFKLNDYSSKKYDDKEKVYYRFLSYNKEFFNNDIDSEKIYHNIAQNILDNGNYRIDRTNTGIYSIFGTQMRFNITNSIPILTTKRVPFKTCIHELLWFLNGNTNNKDLQKNNVHIWDGNSSREFLDKVGLDNLDEGDCGACYGFQWRHFGATYIDCNTDYTGIGFDQVNYVLNLLKNDPFSRRIFLSAWNSADLENTCLPPCHVSIQFYVTEKNNKKYLSGHMYQRSADWFLGEPFNILSYTALVYLFAEICDMIPHELVISTGDTHIYSNHIEQMKKQLSRSYLAKPRLWINPDVKNKELHEISIDDFDLIGYFSHPTIKGKMAV